MKFTNKEEAVKALQGLEGQEFLVFTDKEHSEVLENFKKTQLDIFEKGRIAEVYDSLDKDFTKVLGIKRPSGYGEKRTYEFWPEVAKGLKDKNDELAKEVEKLKVNPNPDLAKELEALRKASIDKDNEWKAKMDKMQADLMVKDVTNTLDGAVRGFKLSDMPKPVVETFIESAKAKLSQSAKFIEGQLVFLDADGNPRINKETFKPYTAAELMAIELDPIIDKTKDKHEGGGTKPPKVTVGKDGKPDITVIVPTSVKNKIELTKFLIEAGLPQGTPEHDTAYAKYGATLPIA